MEGRCRLSKKDQAARIADIFIPPGDWGKLRRDDLTRRIRRAITAAVRKERERCVGIATSVHGSNMHGGRGEGAWACEDIIKAINGGKR